MEKYYILGFPGIGKSSVNFKPRIIDADCERFKFVIPKDIPSDPHSQKNTAYTQRNPSYPNNYLDYIYSVDADMVLLNCHISLLKTLDILDPFAGPGTTVLAAVLEGYTATGIEVSDEYARLARERIIRELEQAA